MLSTKMKKMLSLTLALLMAGSMVACGSSGDGGWGDVSVGEGQTLLKISPFNGGYGLAWLDALKEEYEKKNPDVVIGYSKTIVDRSTQTTAIKSGSADADLYFTSLPVHYDLYHQYLADLSDVYTEISDAVNPSVVNWFKSGENQYAVPWASAVLGILYHKSFFANNNIQVPRTTDELLNAAKTITAMRKNGSTSSYAFSYSDNEDTGECYWDYMFNPWMAQYEGIDYYENYWECKLKDGTQYDSRIVSEYKGVLRTLEVYEELLSSSNEYNHRLSKDDDFTTAQFRFLDGEAQMMVNGDWIVQEMEKSGNYDKEETEDVAFMKTPIISSIVETMPMWEEASNVQYTVDPDNNTGNAVALSADKKAAYESALVAIIDYVDGTTTEKPTNVSGIVISDADIIRIQEARSITPTMVDNHTIVVPKCSKNQEIAKDFIKFMYSQEGIALYANNVYGTGLPANYTPDEIQGLVGNSAFLKSAYDMLVSDNTYFTFYSGGKDVTFTAGGLRPTYRTDGKTFVEVMISSAASIKETAYEFYKSSQTQTVINWENILFPGR